MVKGGASGRGDERSVKVALYKARVRSVRYRLKVKIKTRSFEEVKVCVYIYRIFLINGSMLFCSFLDDMN